MARDLTSAVKAAVILGTVWPYLIVRVDVNGGGVYAWSGIGDLTFDDGDGSQTYSGVGSLGGISVAEETTDLKATGLNLSLSGVPSALLSTALGSMRQGKTARIHVGFYDTSTGSSISDPAEIFAGQVDVAAIEETGESSTITVGIESKLVDLDRKRDRRYTKEDLAIDDPTDRGFDQVPSLQDKEILFGRTR